MGRYEGGFITWPRNLEKLMKTLSPCARDVFRWLIVNANFKSTDKMLRGSLFTNYKEIQSELAWQRGCILKTYEKSQIQSAFKALKNAGLVSTKKTTRGLIVTICDYNTWQNQKRHENHMKTT